MITLYDLAELIATAKREIISAIDGIKKAISEIGKQNAHEAARATVELLKKEGLLRDNSKTAYEKTEALLWQYPTLKNSSTPYARRVVAEIDRLLAEAENEPYVDVIRLYYFGGLKNAACAKTLACGERTARRYRVALVEQFSTSLASDEFIRELLL